MNHDVLIDIFFTITAAAVIIVTILLAIAIIYAISVVYTLRRIVRTAEFAAEMLKDDLTELRNNIKTKGFSLGALAGFLKHLTKRRVISKRNK